MADQLARTAAWKYAGYPAFTNYMASSSDCLSLRRFRSLNIRTLLKLQNDIVGLERQLHEMDEHSMKQPKNAGGCGSFRLDANSPREETLDELGALLHEYNVRIAAFLQIEDRPSASTAQIRNLQTWLANHPNAIEEPEQEFLLRDDDLFAQRTSNRTHFGCWMQAIGLRKVAKMKSGNSTAYYDQGLWKSFGGFLFLISILALFLAPIWTVAFVHRSILRLAAVTAFSIGFVVLLTIGTTLKSSQRGYVLSVYLIFLALALGLSPGWAVGQADQQGGQQPLATAVASTLTSSTSSTPLTATVPSSTNPQTSVPRSTRTATSSSAQTNDAGLTSLRTQSIASVVPASTSLSSLISSTTGAVLSATPSSSDGYLSTGAKAGIGVGTALGALIILGGAAVGLWLYRRRKHPSHSNSVEVEQTAAQEMQKPSATVPAEDAGEEAQLPLYDGSINPFSKSSFVPGGVPPRKKIEQPLAGST